MSDGAVKTHLDRICHSLTTRFGPLPSLYVTQPGHRNPWLRPPTSLAVIEEAERRLGFALPPLMRELYRHVANGGEALLMIGLEPAARHLSYAETRCYVDLVAAYFAEVVYRQEHGPEPWPVGRVPI